MIAHLTGILLSSELTAVVLDVRGVGYEVDVPMGTQGRLQADEQGRVSMWIHTSVREDDISLYGFASREDRQLFRRLTNVSGVGPRTGLATLSELTPAEVISAVRRDEVKTFTRVKGIGKKTAQRLILELKSVVEEFVFDVEDTSLPSGEKVAFDQLRSALSNLGYQPSTISSVVDELRADAGDDPTLDGLLRQALKMLN